MTMYQKTVTVAFFCSTTGVRREKITSHFLSLSLHATQNSETVCRCMHYAATCDVLAVITLFPSLPPFKAVFVPVIFKTKPAPA